MVVLVEDNIYSDKILPSYAFVIGSTTSRTWLETQRQQKLNLEAANAGPDIEAILKDFKVVKKEVSICSII